MVTTVASEVPEELWENYEPVFRRLGVEQLVHMPLESRQSVVEHGAAHQEVVRRARGVFFTGGSQLRITALLGGTPLCSAIEELNARGGALAGTSAGASVMSGTMLVSGTGEKSPRLGDVLRMAPGLGFVPDMIIDQHFAERGRIGRLMAAVAQNAKTLGIGIDEDTAIVVDRPGGFRVIGTGAVYVIDGSTITNTNVVEGHDEQTLSAHGLRVHLLSAGERFDLTARAPEDGRLERQRTEPSSPTT